jgi:hypothetical protein
MQVTCRILLPADDVIGPDALVRVVVEDVSMADAAAPVLGSVTFPAEVGTRELGPFTVEYLPNPAGVAAVRVHIDQNGDSQVQVGDLVSVAHHDALSAVAGSTVTESLLIPVQVVTG